jgi:ribonuclease Z
VRATAHSILLRVPVVAGIRIEGISIAGIETCIDLPQWKIAFDIGRVPDVVVPRATILFTHAHMDHMGGVAWHCATRALRGLAPPTYVVGPENADAFRDLFEVWRRLDRSKLPCNIVVMGPGDELPLGPRRIARAFRSVHRAPCQGYAIVEKRTKLAARLAGLSQEEIDAARVVGETIVEESESVALAFCGDTSIEVVEQQALVRDARVLVLECTFLDERVSPASAREMGHVHLDDLIERADLFQNEAILLTHLSARYRSDEVVSILARRLPAGLRERVVPFLPGK